MRSLTNTSIENRSNVPSTVATWIRPHRKTTRELAYLQSEADAAKRAMRQSFGQMRKAANPVALLRAYPIAAGALAGVAAVAAAASLAGRHGREPDAADDCPREPVAATVKRGMLHDVGRAVRGGLISVLTAKLLSMGTGASSDDPNAPAE